MHEIEIGPIKTGNTLPLTVIAGPCQLESHDHAQMIAGQLSEVCASLGLKFVFKGSFDKANRTSMAGKRGLGLEKSLEIHAAIKSEFGCPVLTDIHTPEQCAEVAEVCDIIQIPAFLCRQTDLLIAAAKTGAVINIKKGQFLAPWDMVNVVGKVEAAGNTNILLTERGASFGYNALVADMRSLPEMAKTGYPVIMDATHAVAQPGGLGGSSGGQREFAPVLARAAVATGIAGVFLETHEDPDNAPSDGPNMIHLSDMKKTLSVLAELDQVAKAHPITL